ncbi:hypothetical protein HDV00_001888 [Rhizophlyctis rosea]|nr:hypothetical protein HDV00_001888 [Rhizophlyctis rosea]
MSAKVPVYPVDPVEREAFVNFKTNRPVTPFMYRVYDLCSQIPAGKFSTYKHISDALNSSPRAVGQALRNNPFAPTVPCHRVLTNSCFIGGFDGEWGAGLKINDKKSLLALEGLAFDDEDHIDTSLRSLRLFNAFVVPSSVPPAVGKSRVKVSRVKVSKRLMVTAV